MLLIVRGRGAEMLAQGEIVRVEAARGGAALELMRGRRAAVRSGSRGVTPPKCQKASCSPSFNDRLDSDWHGTAHSQLEYGSTEWHSR